MDARRYHCSVGVVLCQVLLLSSVFSPIDAKKKPKNPADYFNLCNRKDPDLNGCVKRAIETLKPRLVKGIPDLQILPMDPLHIPRMEFNDGAGNFAFRQTMTNVTITGLGNFEITDLKVDLSKPYMEIDMTTPFMQFQADYEVEGKILVLPINGNGDVVFNFTGVRTLAKVPSKFEIRDDEKYMSLLDVLWTIEVQGARIHFNNLFNGDKMLGDAMNKFLNDNWKEAFETYRHLPEQAFGELFKDLGNRVYQQFTFDQLFLE